MLYYTILYYLIELSNITSKKKKEKKKKNKNMPSIINLLQKSVQDIEQVCYTNTTTNKQFNDVLDQFYNHLNQIYDNYDITTSNDYQIRICEKKVEDLISHFNSGSN